MELGIDLEGVLEQRSWVIDGIFLWNIAPALEAAEVVVWLDLPYRTAVRRIVLRHAIASARRNNRHRGLRKLCQFAWSSRWYWKTPVPRTPTGPTDWGALTRAQTIATIEPYRHKVIRLRSPRDVYGWVAKLERNELSSPPRLHFEPAVPRRERPVAYALGVEAGDGGRRVACRQPPEHPPAGDLAEGLG